MVARVLVVDDHFLNVKLLDAPQLASTRVVTAGGPRRSKGERRRPNGAAGCDAGMDGYESAPPAPIGDSAPARDHGDRPRQDSDARRGHGGRADDYTQQARGRRLLFPAIPLLQNRDHGGRLRRLVLRKVWEPIMTAKLHVLIVGDTFSNVVLLQAKLLDRQFGPRRLQPRPGLIDTQTFDLGFAGYHAAGIDGFEVTGA